MSPSSNSPIVAAAGGSFLLESRTPAEVFTPEDLNEEQRQIAATAAQFAREQILPKIAAIEAKEPGVLVGLMRKAGDLGFTSVDIPEEYGGMGMDKTTSTIVTDHLSVLGAFRLPSARTSALPRCRWSGTALRSRSSAICPGSARASGSAATRSQRPAPAPMR